MKYTLIDSYKNTLLAPRDMNEVENRILFSFRTGPKVEVLGDIDTEYEIDFIDQDKGSIVYTTKIKNNMWTAANPKYYINWMVNVKKNGVLIAQETLNLSGKKVKVVLDTQSIGDFVAYIGAVSEFQKKHNCILTCVVFNAAIFDILKTSYSNITFVSVNEKDEDYYATYMVGWFIEWEGRIAKNPRGMSLGNVASNILGFGLTDFKPELKFSRKKNEGKKYVCIGIQSTSQFKYWNNPTGWDDVVRHLKKLGYDVWCIDRHDTFGTSGKMNHMPKGVINKTGNFTLTQRLEQLSGAEFFIGLSSGLSWLAWAADIPVVLISGIGEKWTEFFTPHRIINENVCHGCSNDANFRFEKDNWMFCPRKKDFECTTTISSETVISEIDKLQTTLYKTVFNHFEFGDSVPTYSKHGLYQEIVLDRVYESVFGIEMGDVVVDLGAHVGMFACHALENQPSLVVAVEPSALRVAPLRKNLTGHPAVVIHAGIGAENKFIKDGLIFDDIVEDLQLVTLADVMAEAKISKIDFLKIDIEGGEYDILTAENFDWVAQNIKKIAGECHLETHERKEAFRKFRDTYLAKLDPQRYTINSVDGSNIKWDLFNEHFLEYYAEIIFTIDNRIDTPLKDVISSATTSRVLITGISGGLGQALERECLARKVDYIGLVNKHGNGKHINCDFSKLADVAKLESLIAEKNITCLVNNAGIYSNEDITTISDERLQEVMNINLVAPMLLSKYVYKHLVATKQEGMIINVNSLAGKYPNFSESVYCASKYGLAGFGASLSINQKTSKIKIVDIHVGAMKTNMTKDRPNHNNMMDPNEISNYILDTIKSKCQYAPSSVELRNTK